eukprot:m.339101 g.339101  ORF g.339101 m.339101 type:complete len:360 (+) comp18662_c0_seq1:155-1234(+)
MGLNASRCQGSPSNKHFRRSISLPVVGENATGKGAVPVVLITSADEEACSRYISDIAAAYHVSTEDIPLIGKGSHGHGISNALLRRARRSHYPHYDNNENDVHDPEKRTKGVTLKFSSGFRLHVRAVPLDMLEPILEAGLPKRVVRASRKGNGAGTQQREIYSIRGVQYVVPVLRSVTTQQAEQHVNACLNILQYDTVQEYLNSSFLVVLDGSLPPSQRSSTPPPAKKKRPDEDLSYEDERKENEFYSSVCRAWNLKPLEEEHVETISLTSRNRDSNQSIQTDDGIFGNEPSYRASAFRDKAILRQVETGLLASCGCDGVAPVTRSVWGRDYYSIKCAVKQHMDIIKQDIMKDMMEKYS